MKQEVNLRLCHFSFRPAAEVVAAVGVAVRCVMHSAAGACWLGDSPPPVAAAPAQNCITHKLSKYALASDLSFMRLDTLTTNKASARILLETAEIDVFLL